MKLAVFSRNIGGQTETFIRRHVQDLAPGRTVALAVAADAPGGGAWRPSCPTLVLDQVYAGDFARAYRGILRRAGRSAEELTARRFLERHGARVFLGQYLDRSLRWQSLVQGSGMAFFAHAHGQDVSRALRHEHWRREYLRYNDANGVITMSQFSKRRLVELGIADSKVHVVPYGVDVADHVPERDPQPIIRCLAVGRMVAKKGPILLLDAFRRAVQQVPSLRLDYVGAGELLPAAKQFVLAAGLTESVTFHGYQDCDTVRRLMVRAAIFVQHSMTDPDTGDQEGLPVAILEAMGVGLPVVSTNHAGIPEAVTDGVTGVLVAEGDTTSMADALVQLAKSPDLMARLGSSGWSRACLKFTWSRERQELLQVLGLPS